VCALLTCIKLNEELNTGQSGKKGGRRVKYVMNEKKEV
jgi:hypothetical protein